jgi:predicted TIM-barrel fold metal-dependent hydrolase
VEERRLLLISADCHAGPAEMADYRPYLDAAHRPAFDDYVAAIRAYEARNAKDQAHGGAPSRPGDEGLWDVAARTRCLDADGVAAEIIYAQGAIPFGDYPAVASSNTEKVRFAATPDQAAAACRAYNRWLAELCAADPDRHIGIARIPLPDVGKCVAEVAWAKAAGLSGGVFLPPVIHEEAPRYNDPVYEPLWAACEDHGMTLNLHGGAGLLYGLGVEANALRLAEVDWFSRRSLWYLIFSGVFERHPRLHLALTEQRAHWVPAMLEELDSIYLWSGSKALRQVLPRTPSQYFADNCFVGASFMSRLECEARREIGVGNIMWGSDYPHQEGTWPWTDTALRWVFGASGAPIEDVRAMVGENAARCYRLDLAAVRRKADQVGPPEASLRLPVSRDELPIFTDRMSSWAFRQSGPWH